MATNAATYDTQTLSTPKLLVDGVVWQYIPNTMEIHIPGEAKVRAVSSGGGSTSTVSGFDASTNIGHIKFDMPYTARNRDRAYALKQNMKKGIGSVIQVVYDDNVQDVFTNMQTTKGTTGHAKADGNITFEFEGNPPF